MFLAHDIFSIQKYCFASAREVKLEEPTSHYAYPYNEKMQNGITHEALTQYRPEPKPIANVPIATKLRQIVDPSI